MPGTASNWDTICDLALKVSSKVINRSFKRLSPNSTPSISWAAHSIKPPMITYNDAVEFFTPDIYIEDAEKYLPIIFEKRGISPEPALAVLTNLKPLLQIADKSIYQEHAAEAQQRIKKRDIHDWPVVATALTLNSPVWTEDQDFFGSGLSVWTTDRIHLFFELLI